MELLCRRLGALRRLTNGGSATARGVRSFRTTAVRSFLPARDENLEDEENKLIVKEESNYDRIDAKLRHRRTFVEAISKYLKVQNVHRRGHVEFIYASLSKMEDFKVNKDLSVYKEILELFPKEKMVPKNAWQVEMQHYPKQQQCCIDVLDKMEFNGVIPDDSMGYQLIKIFGDKSHVFRKYRRMMYWLPKFKYANPYHVPHELPTEAIALAVMALKRISVDLQNNITVLKSDKDSYEDTFIASAQSTNQIRLIEDHVTRFKRHIDNQSTTDKVGPLYVQGGYTVWLRGVQQTYFLLRALDPSPVFAANLKLDKDENSHQQRTDAVLMVVGHMIMLNDDFKNWTMFGDKRKTLLKAPSRHEQLDGTIMAACITGTSSKDSLTSWVRYLEKSCPAITGIPVLFMLKSQENTLVAMDTETAKLEFIIMDENCESILTKLRSSVDGNEICAECSRQEPEYVVWNKGIFVCKKCSEVHRCQVDDSKVKSLKFDTFNRDQISVMKMNGNTKMNTFYEYNLPQFYRKPTPDGPFLLLCEFIRRKYLAEFSSSASYVYVDTHGVRDGLLYKRGKSDNRYNSRRFVLDEQASTLRYYNREDAKEPKCVISLDELNATFQPIKTGQENGMQLTFEQDGQTRNIFVYSSYVADIHDWYMAIRKAKLMRLKVAFPGTNEDELLARLTRDFVREGYLCKTGPKNTDVYRKRWFTLDKRKLTYYENQTDANPKGEIFLGVKGYSIHEGLNEGVRDAPNAFTLVTPERCYALSADCGNDRHLWIDSIRRVLGQPLTPQESACLFRSY